MTLKKLPDNLHRDTLAVRVAVERSQYGENSEALYLTSGFLQPDAETSARRFAGKERGKVVDSENVRQSDTGVFTVISITYRFSFT